MFIGKRRGLVQRGGRLKRREGRLKMNELSQQIIRDASGKTIAVDSGLYRCF